MPITREQAETVAEQLLANADADRDATRFMAVKGVPFIYRSQASRQLDRRQEWSAYREAASRPFNRHPIFVGILFACLATIFLLFWFGTHPISGWAFALTMFLLIVPHIVRIVLVRRSLAALATECASAPRLKATSSP